MLSNHLLQQGVVAFNSGGDIECFLCRYNLWYDKKYKFFDLSIDFCVDLWYFCFIQFINFVRRV
mgnify:CR=1 FL=1